MPRLRPGLALLGMSLLAACAASKDDLVSEKLDGFIGMSRESLVGLFGKPTRDSIRQDGLRHVTFRQSRQTESSGFHIPTTQTETVNGTIFGRDGRLRSYSETRTHQVDGIWMPARTDHWFCRLGFALDAGGHAVSYTYDDPLDCYYALRLDLYR
jgi:hypothetical protein